MRIIARTLARYRDSEARSDIGGVVAMITCDLSDDFKASDPNFEYLEFWNMVEDARRVERNRQAAWLREARARMENNK